MKTLLPLSLLFLVGQNVAQAQWAVIDATNLKQSIINHSVMAKQLEHQATQIVNQVQQIRQMEDQLKRLGDMKTYTDLIGFKDLKLELELPSQLKEWKDSVGKVDGAKLFGDTRGGIFTGIKAEFKDFDGAVISRKNELFKEAQTLISSVDQFRDVQADILKRRGQLKKAIGATSEALQAAKTEAEQKKLDSVLQAQYGALEAADAELEISAAEIQAKMAEAVAMETAQLKAEAETRARLVQSEAKKISEAFQISYDSPLKKF
jgi:type IV secretion system protein TrbJ